MEQHYKGVYSDLNGGMTHLAQIIKDAWVFGLLPEEQDGAGWTGGQIQQLYDKVSVEWEKYGHLPSRLTPELRERHQRIHEEAVKRARKGGWNPELGEDD
ncbi:MAG: hypothetical protein GJU77_04210 [Ferrovum sp.]|jgi:hypothetical protein|nr:hypothetical protein [Ferrovum sp.]NDU90930.1 hypothetical protein [Ferrovum sp.]